MTKDLSTNQSYHRYLSAHEAEAERIFSSELPPIKPETLIEEGATLISKGALNIIFDRKGIYARAIKHLGKDFADLALGEAICKAPYGAKVTE